MGKVFVLILLLVGVARNAPGFQERQIYYSEQDNVCKYGSGNDEYALTITLDGAPAE